MKKPSGPYADKVWREALRKAVFERIEGEQKLDRIARQVVAQALDGDDKAYREIGDRLDGKATQAMEHTGPDGGAIPLKLIELIGVRPDEAAD